MSLLRDVAAISDDRGVAGSCRMCSSIETFLYEWLVDAIDEGVRTEVGGLASPVEPNSGAIEEG